MTEHPIIFSGPMVRSILAGTKTQTRRPVKWRICPGNEGLNLGASSLSASAIGSAWTLYYRGTMGLWQARATARCPYGVPGDRLWVKEAFIAGTGVGGCVNSDSDKPINVIYRADDGANERSAGPWKSFIYMPRWASRITLEVTDVRVERVQSISEEDAIAEGAEPVLVPPDGGSAPHAEGFNDFWTSIYAKRGYGWDANPWVWAITFRRVQP